MTYPHHHANDHRFGSRHTARRHLEQAHGLVPSADTDDRLRALERTHRVYHSPLSWLARYAAKALERRRVEPVTTHANRPVRLMDAASRYVEATRREPINRVEVTRLLGDVVEAALAEAAYRDVVGDLLAELESVRRTGEI